MGLITNGTFLERIANIKYLTYLGVSLDATTATTWSKTKRSPEANFHKIIDNIKHIRQTLPDLDLSIKFLRWRAEKSLSKQEFGTYALPTLQDAPPLQTDNAADAEILPEFAKELGCNYILKDCYPKDFNKSYKFETCRATPLGGVFAADHRFHLCCDARSIFVLTDDYTRDDWKELPSLWGGEKHQQLIASIDPQKCVGCAKHKLNDILENVVCDGEYTKERQVNFI